MAGFASSFEKSFIPAAKSSSDATADLIKQSIAKQEAKTLEEAKVLKAQKDYDTLRTFIAKKNPQLANDLGQLDVNDMSPDTLNTINKMLTKQVDPTEELKPKQKGAFVVERDQSGKYNLRNVVTQEIVTDPSKISADANIFKETMSVDEYAKRQKESTEARLGVEAELKPGIAAEVKRAQEEVKLDYPTLDEKSKSAISAYKFITPRIDKLNTLIDSNVFGDGGVARLAKQISIGPKGDFIVPNGSPLEEVIGLYNDIKLTGFNIAGTAFTGTEKETAFALLDPRAKSDKRIKRDLASFQELFGSRVEAGVAGLRGAKETAKEIKAKREGSSEGTLGGGVKWKVVK